MWIGETNDGFGNKGCQKLTAYEVILTLCTCKLPFGKDILKASPNTTNSSSQDSE